MAGRTMGEERDWQQLLRSLRQIAENTGRIADALGQPQKESNAHTYEVDYVALRREFDRIIAEYADRAPGQPGRGPGEAADDAADGPQGGDGDGPDQGRR